MFRSTRLFQVYIDGQPIKKQFKVRAIESLWNQFNKWAKESKHCTEYEITNNGNVLGRMYWLTPKGEKIEVREAK